MENYPQEISQYAVCQSHTGHMTGLWFLPTRPLRLNTNEWMVNIYRFTCFNMCTQSSWTAKMLLKETISWQKCIVFSKISCTFTETRGYGRPCPYVRLTARVSKIKKFFTYFDEEIHMNVTTLSSPDSFWMLWHWGASSSESAYVHAVSWHSYHDKIAFPVHGFPYELIR